MLAAAAAAGSAEVAEHRGEAGMPQMLDPGAPNTPLSIFASFCNPSYPISTLMMLLITTFSI
jgi:hypothetical protein